LIFISGKTGKQGQVYFEDVSAWWFSYFGVTEPPRYSWCQV